MAAARKKFKVKGNPRPVDQAAYAAFMAAVLAGEIAPTKLVESHNGSGRLELEYEDGTGQTRKPR